LKNYLSIVAALALVVGCTESKSPFDSALTLDDVASPESYSSKDAGSSSLRRLTRSQFSESVRALLGDTIVVPKLSEPDTIEDGLLSIGASTTTFSPRGVETLEATAYSIAEQAVEIGAHSSFLSCTAQGIVDDACTNSFIESFGKLAWRRPLTTAEVDEIRTVATLAAQTLSSFEQGLVFAMASILQSPYFLFRVELGPELAAGAQSEFTGLDLASRLSYFLWNATPDIELLNAAESGLLGTREGLFTQASRLLEHPNARLGIRNFFSEQFQLQKLESYSKDPEVFEHFHNELGDNAREETLQLLEYIVFDTNGDFRDSVTADYAFVNARLSALYGIPAPVKEGFGYTDLTPESKRVGLLGQASFLGLHAHPVSSSATLRGRAVRNILLCQSVPAPPVDVDTSIPEPSGTTLTLRERVAEHLTEPGCAACHQFTDPIGLALENFDGIGRFRERDNGERIDASGDLDGARFEDMIGLASAVREHPAFAPCMVRTLSHYAMGRVATQEERSWVSTLSDRFEGHGYRMKRLILEFIMSPLFTKVGAPQEVEESP
jgi:hypothetical protein